VREVNGDANVVSLRSTAIHHVSVGNLCGGGEEEAERGRADGRGLPGPGEGGVHQVGTAH